MNTENPTSATPEKDEQVKLIDVRAFSRKEIQRANLWLSKAQIARKNGVLFANATDANYEAFAREQCGKRVKQAEKSVIKLAKIVKVDTLRRIKADMEVETLSKEILDYDILTEVQEDELNSYEGFLSKRILKRIQKTILEVKKYD